MASRRTSQHGFIALQALFLGIVLAGVSIAFLTHGLGEARSVSQYESSTVALELAETGLVRSEMEFTSQVDADGGGIGAVRAEWRGGDYDAQSFSVSVEPGQPGTWVLRSTGEHRMAVRRVEVGIRVWKALVFPHALFARDRLDFDSSFSTDSYDSRLGTYASQAVRSDALGSYADPAGHVGSNGPIRVAGSVIVRGDARAAPGFSTSVVGGSSSVLGDRSPTAAPLDVPDPRRADFEAAFLDNENGRDVSAGGDVTWDATRRNLRIDGNGVVRLRGGTYFFHDVVLDSNAVLQVDAPSTVYVTGRLTFDSSSRINHAGAPRDLLIVAHPYPIAPGYAAPTTPITFNSSFVGRLALYAPGRDVELNSSVELHGAVVGRRILATSSGRVHHDRALAERPDGVKPAVTERLYWRELSPPGR